MVRNLSQVPLYSGDVIGVAYTNTFQVAIFRGYGSAGNTQFYPISWFESIVRITQQGRKMPVAYINTNPDGRVVKLTQAAFTDDSWKEIEQFRDFLLKNNYIK